MGVLNVTPDSFSDGGRHDSVRAAVERARRLVESGADIVDIGAESTRPGAVPVSAREEMVRLLPVVRAVREALPETPISVDTYKAEVAGPAIGEGADIINDVHGGRQRACLKELDSPMCRMAAELRAPIILMHNREHAEYTDFWTQFLGEMHESLAMARQAGLPPHQVWVDPGFGFGKKPEHNLEVTRGLDRLVALGHPVLYGASNKSTLGKVLGREDPNGRHEGNVAAHLWAVQAGAAMVRVHEPAKIRDYLKVADAIRAGLAWRG